MKTALLQYLVCSVCHQPFTCETRTEESGEIMEGTLTCPQGHGAHQIRRGIPRFWSPSTELTRRTSAAFGYEWRAHPEIAPYYERQFLDWITPVTPEAFRGCLVLDAGCGKGRHLGLAVRYGARAVIGVDLSTAIEAAYANTRHVPNVHLIQADLCALPLVQSFDYIYSIGVVHHLQHPADGVSALVQHVRPGGTISIWVYAREGNEWLVRWVDPWRRYFTSWLPRPILQAGTVLLSAPLFVYLRLRYRNHSSASPRGLYGGYLSSIAVFPFREVHHILFDQLNAPVAHYARREEVAQWLEAAGLSETVLTWHHGNSWCAYGRRPSE